MPCEGVLGALFNEGVIRTLALSAHSRVIASGPRQTWRPWTHVLLPVLEAVATEANSATAAAPIGVVDGGVDDAMYARPFYSRMPDTTA